MHPKNLQIDGGWNICIYTHDPAQGGALIAQVITTPASSLTINPLSPNKHGYNPETDPAAGTELWWVKPNNISGLNGTQIYITREALGASVTLASQTFNPQDPAFSSPERATWAEIVDPAVTGFKGRDDITGNDLYADFETEETNGVWSITRVTWYLADEAPGSSGTVRPSAGPWTSYALPSGTYYDAATEAA